MLHPNPAVNRLLWLLRAVLLATGAALFYKTLFYPLLPLLLAFALSCAIVRPAEALRRKTRLPMGICALLLTLALLTAAGAGIWLLGRLAAGLLAQLVAQLPSVLQSMQATLDALQHRLEGWFPGKAASLPPLLSPESWLENLRPPEIRLSSLAESLGDAAASLPNFLLTAVFFLAATVLFASRRKEVVEFVRRQLPPRLLDALSRLRQYLIRALWGWCKAQGILAAVTFGILLAGFFLLRVPAALLLAIAVAALDALPVLGSGLVLVPWAAVELLAGDYGRGAGLLLLFAAAAGTRSALEPHVIGKQIGLHPLVSLIGFYLGWRLAGVWGMIFAPILLLSLVKLQEWGYSRLWR